MKPGIYKRITSAAISNAIPIISASILKSFSIAIAKLFWAFVRLFFVRNKNEEAEHQIRIDGETNLLIQSVRPPRPQMSPNRIING